MTSAADPPRRSQAAPETAAATPAPRRTGAVRPAITRTSPAGASTRSPRPGAEVTGRPDHRPGNPGHRAGALHRGIAVVRMIFASLAPQPVHRSLRRSALRCRSPWRSRRARRLRRSDRLHRWHRRRAPQARRAYRASCWRSAPPARGRRRSSAVFRFRSLRQTRPRTREGVNGGQVTPVSEPAVRAGESSLTQASAFSPSLPLMPSPLGSRAATAPFQPSAGSRDKTRAIGCGANVGEGMDGT